MDYFKDYMLSKALNKFASSLNAVYCNQPLNFFTIYLQELGLRLEDEDMIIILNSVHDWVLNNESAIEEGKHKLIIGKIELDKYRFIDVEKFLKLDDENVEVILTHVKKMLCIVKGEPTKEQRFFEGMIDKIKTHVNYRIDNPDTIPSSEEVEIPEELDIKSLKENMEILSTDLQPFANLLPEDGETDSLMFKDLTNVMTNLKKKHTDSPNLTTVIKEIVADCSKVAKETDIDYEVLYRFIVCQVRQLYKEKGVASKYELKEEDIDKMFDIMLTMKFDEENENGLFNVIPQLFTLGQSSGIVSKLPIKNMVNVISTLKEVDLD